MKVSEKLPDPLMIVTRGWPEAGWAVLSSNLVAFHICAGSHLNQECVPPGQEEPAKPALRAGTAKKTQPTGPELALRGEGIIKAHAASFWCSPVIVAC